MPVHFTTGVPRRKRISAAEHRALLRGTVQHVAEVRPATCVAYMRASTPTQRQQGRLDDRCRCLVADLENRGVHVAGTYTDVAAGRQLDDRPGLVDAIRAARQLQAREPGQVVAVATDCRNRFLRGRSFNRRADSDRISAGQWEQLEELADGVPLVTLHPPGSPFAQVRRLEMETRRRCGGHIGRPPKQRKPRVPAERKAHLIAKARRLHAKGRSLRQIAEFLTLNGHPVSHMSVARWL